MCVKSDLYSFVKRGQPFLKGLTNLYMEWAFGPFYGSYVVFKLERENYDYAFVSGPNTNYLWLLSRTPSVPPEVIERFRMSAGELGFDTRELIFVEHSDAALH